MPSEVTTLLLRAACYVIERFVKGGDLVTALSIKFEPGYLALAYAAGGIVGLISSATSARFGTRMIVAALFVGALTAPACWHEAVREVPRDLLIVTVITNVATWAAIAMAAVAISALVLSSRRSPQPEF